MTPPVPFHEGVIGWGIAIVSVFMLVVAAVALALALLIFAWWVISLVVGIFRFFKGKFFRRKAEVKPESSNIVGLIVTIMILLPSLLRIFDKKRQDG